MRCTRCRKEMADVTHTCFAVRERAPYSKPRVIETRPVTLPDIVAAMRENDIAVSQNELEAYDALMGERAEQQLLEAGDET